LSSANNTNNTSESELSDFKEFFDTYYDSIRNYIYFKTSDTQLSEDLVQEVFLKLWSMRNTIIPDSVKSLLYTIADNLCKNYFKHKKVEYNFVNNFVSDEKNESPQFLMEVKEFDKYLQKTIADIPEKSRMVFLMNRIDGLTYNEIAERLGLSVKAIEKRMQGALNIIKEKFDFKI